MNQPAKVERQQQDQKLPHSIEAEQAVLGGLMLRNDAFDTVAAALRANDFFKTEHRVIFEAMSRLAEKTEPFDPITLSESLDNHGELEIIGGIGYLVELTENTPTAANLNAYSKIVLERSILRQLIAYSTDIAQKSHSPLGLDSAALLADAERRLLAITESRPQTGGFKGMDEVLKESLQRLDAVFKSKESITGLSTGFKDLDEKTSGWQKADLIIVAGRPSMGKTSFAMNLVEHAVLNQSRPVLVFSLEMPANQLVTRMLSSIGKIDQTRMRNGELETEDWSRLTTATTKLRTAPLYIDDTPGITPLTMRNQIKQFVKEQTEKLVRAYRNEHGEEAEIDMDAMQDQAKPALMMVDYLQLMNADTTGEGRTQEISQISRELKQLAREYDCPMIALSQLSRNVEQRPDKRPVNSDLRESGAIEQDADVICFIYRDEVYKPDTEEKGIAEVIIGKQRNGPIGTCKLAFQGKYTRFDNLSYNYADYDE